MTIIDETADNRFAVTIDGHEAQLVYRVEANRVVLVHTEVPEALGGQGIGAALVTAAVERCETTGETLEPECTYAQGWLRKHPDVAERVTVDWPADPADDAPAMSPFDAEYEPSSWDMIAAEVARYEQSNGTAASELVGDEWIVLWTIGAKSGHVRKTPLVRTSDGTGRYAVIGSQGGAPTNPNWVHNLRAHPIARVQDGAVVHELVAREAEGDEKATWWARAMAVWPSYDDYQAATDRWIPLFVLEPG
ncbi:MAG: nitroreductase family deazaflavin-dependent oxidoreductase [Actinobacteria bacterium]|nr:nitroreductase family deazaflavin-dependent oxidoreductase [Actinomycetota bacterium]